MNKDIYCENSKEYEFIKKFLNIKLLIEEPSESDYPIVMFDASEFGYGKRWSYLENIPKNSAEFHKEKLIFAKHIIRNEKLNKICKDE